LSPETGFSWSYNPYFSKVHLMLLIKKPYLGEGAAGIAGFSRQFLTDGSGRA
jgi:hypothetical protein